MSMKCPVGTAIKETGAGRISLPAPVERRREWLAAAEDGAAIAHREADRGARAAHPVQAARRPARLRAPRRPVPRGYDRAPRPDRHADHAARAVHPVELARRPAALRAPAAPAVARRHDGPPA